MKFSPTQPLHLIILLLFLGACDGSILDSIGGGPGQGGGGTEAISEEATASTRPTLADCDTFEPSVPEVYGSKVKNLLTGEPLTDQELNLLIDGGELSSLVSGWTQSSVWQAKLQDYFEHAFQQDLFTERDFANQIKESSLGLGELRDSDNNKESMEETVHRNFEESFARTVMSFVDAGDPFNKVLTTTSFYMTTAMMSVMAFMDERVVTDDGKKSYRTLDDVIEEVYYQRSPAIPESQSLDPSHANFGRFSTEYMHSDCDLDPPVATQNKDKVRTFFRAMFGAPTGHHEAAKCDKNPRNVQFVKRADFEDWRLVTVRRPRAGEKAMQFYELSKMRGSKELVVHTPRVGFFTTPAFFARWVTNDDNEARLTINQTMVVTYGVSFDGSDVIIPAFDDALDDNHADPSTACWGCHKTLDPMRQFFRNSYTYYYHEQQDESVKATQAVFAFTEANEAGEDVFDLANHMSGHSKFAPAWVQKLCHYFNSAPCPEDDPEFERVTEVFRNSGLNFQTMLVELLSSPLVTGAQCVQSGSADFVSVSRTRHFCTTLSQRLEIPDVCGLTTRSGSRTELQKTVNDLVDAIPDDVFSRGGEQPITISDASFMIYLTYERICEGLADKVVGNGGIMGSMDSSGAIDWVVTQLMSLPQSDPRHGDVTAVLQEHYTAAEGVRGANDALKSTFVLGCMSPKVIGVGI